MVIKVRPEDTGKSEDSFVLSLERGSDSHTAMGFVSLFLGLSSALCPRITGYYYIK